MAAFEFESGRVEFQSSGFGVTDNVLPVFAGLFSVAPQDAGQFLLNWPAATDNTTPIKYKIYVAPGSVSAGTLFSQPPAMIVEGSLKAQIFMLADQTTFFVKGSTYSFGVKAEDRFGNVDSNTVVLTATATASGNLPGIFQQYLDTLNTQNTTLGAANTAYGNLNTAHSNLNTVYDSLNDDHDALNTAQDANNTVHAQNNDEQEQLNDDYAASSGSVTAAVAKIENASQLIAVSVL